MNMQEFYNAAEALIKVINDSKSSFAGSNIDEAKEQMMIAKDLNVIDEVIKV